MRNVRKWNEEGTKVEKGMYESGMRNVERGMYETTKVEAFFDKSTNVDCAEESRASEAQGAVRSVRASGGVALRSRARRHQKKGRRRRGDRPRRRSPYLLREDPGGGSQEWKACRTPTKHALARNRLLGTSIPTSILFNIKRPHLRTPDMKRPHLRAP